MCAFCLAKSTHGTSLVLENGYRACSELLLPKHLLLAFNTLKQLVEGVRKLLHTFLLQLLSNLVVVDSDFLEGREFSLRLWDVVLDAVAHSSMIAEVLDRLQWHSVHGVRADQLL